MSRPRSARHSPAASRPAEVLVLARTGYATEPVQAALARAGIPHRVLGSLGLYERAEVNDALAYLALLANPADAQAFRRAVGSPRRGVGAATANRVIALARDTHQRRPDRGERARERDRGHPLARRARAAHAVRRRTRPRPPRAARRALARARRGRRGDARRRTRRPPPAPARQLPETRGAPRRRAGARGPALAVPRRPGLRGAAHRQRHADRVPRAGRRPARPRDRRRRTGPEDHRLDDPPRQGDRGAARRAARLRGAAAAVLALARLTGPRAAGRGAPAVLRRLHPRQGPADHHPRGDARRPAHRRPVPLPRTKPD